MTPLFTNIFGDFKFDSLVADGQKYKIKVKADGLEVSDKGYFVYCNGRRDLEKFDGKLEFVIKVLPYTGSDEWVEGTIKDIFETLESDEVPSPDPDCDFCKYTEEAGGVSKS